MAVIQVALLAALQANQAPWFGRWQLEGPRPPYKRVTLRIEPWQDGLRVSYDMVGVRGGVVHTEWVGRLDGRDYAMQGLDYAMTNAYSPAGENGYTILVKVDGRPASRVTVSVSPDGKTMKSITSESSSTSIYVRLP